MPPLNSESDQFRSVRANASNALSISSHVRQTMEDMVTQVKGLHQRVMSLEHQLIQYRKQTQAMEDRLRALEAKLKINTD